jgi:hypothetical protein
MFDRRELGQFRLTIITQPHSRPTQKGYLNPKIATFRAGNFGYIISKYPKSYMISYDTPAKIGGGGSLRLLVWEEIENAPTLVNWLLKPNFGHTFVFFLSQM